MNMDLLYIQSLLLSLGLSTAHLPLSWASFVGCSETCPCELIPESFLCLFACGLHGFTVVTIFCLFTFYKSLVYGILHPGPCVPSNHNSRDKLRSLSSDPSHWETHPGTPGLPGVRALGTQDLCLCRSGPALLSASSRDIMHDLKSKVRTCF